MLMINFVRSVVIIVFGLMMKVIYVGSFIGMKEFMVLIVIDLRVILSMVLERVKR